MKPPIPATNAETVEELIKLSHKAPPGCFVEIGVGQGGTSYLLYQLVEEQNRQLHLFDERLEDPIKNLCPKAIQHLGKFPETWVNMGNVAFCFFDLANIEAAKFLIGKMPTDFVKKGIALFYPYNKDAIDYNVHPDWTIGGRGNMRYPYVENR